VARLVIQSAPQVTPNNSFEPTPLRGASHSRRWAQVQLTRSFLMIRMRPRAEAHTL
jgi:hypothetical protein